MNEEEFQYYEALKIKGQQFFARVERIAKLSQFIPKPIRYWFHWKCPKCGSRLKMIEKLTYRYYLCACGYEYAEINYIAGPVV